MKHIITKTMHSVTVDNINLMQLFLNFVYYTKIQGCHISILNYSQNVLFDAPRRLSRTHSCVCHQK